MARSVHLVSTIFVFLLLLLVAIEMGPIMVAEARICESPSHAFKGVCMSDTNCASVCLTEGFSGGHCVGLRRRCFCTKPC
ncbi:defensin Ec-AMP-D1-like isoform X1 [Trifolium pratense]|uniref:defensin Ec-AMP-D1-like isoform X1 n=1 Tax=Trifolium pratense TaxID=57577 RepID=UPI001E695E6C|nr:defensin Ec-AMP-D1-like isoform X1 [Trifolium pratense]